MDNFWLARLVQHTGYWNVKISKGGTYRYHFRINYTENLTRNGTSFTLVLTETSWFASSYAEDFYTYLTNNYDMAKNKPYRGAKGEYFYMMHYNDEKTLIETYICSDVKIRHMNMNRLSGKAICSVVFDCDKITKQ